MSAAPWRCGFWTAALLICNSRSAGLIHAAGTACVIIYLDAVYLFICVYMHMCVMCSRWIRNCLFLEKANSYISSFSFFVFVLLLLLFFNRQKLATMNLTSLALWTSLVSWPSHQIRTKKWRRRFLSSTSPTGQLGSSFELVYVSFMCLQLCFKKNYISYLYLHNWTSHRFVQGSFRCLAQSSFTVSVM